MQYLRVGESTQLFVERCNRITTYVKFISQQPEFFELIKKHKIFFGKGLKNYLQAATQMKHWASLMFKINKNFVESVTKWYEAT